MNNVYKVALEGITKSTLSENQLERLEPLILIRNDVEITKVISEGLTVPNGREIGNGTILETIGIVAGNSILDAISANPLFTYVKPLLDQGRLIASSPLVTQTVNGFVTAGLLNQTQADAIIALGKQPLYIPLETVSNALNAVEI